MNSISQELVTYASAEERNTRIYTVLNALCALSTVRRMPTQLPARIIHLEVQSPASIAHKELESFMRAVASL